jgi:L-fucose isomerase-like protein
MSEMTRRSFNVSLCGFGLSGLLPAAEEEPIDGPWSGPAVVAKVYLTAPETHWPKPGLDVKAAAAEVDARLTEVERKHAKNLRFTGGQVLKTADEIESWARGLKDVDAVLMVPLSTPSVSVPAVVDAAKVPCLCFSRPYAGHHWSGIAALRKTGRKVDVLPTSSYGDLDAWVPVWRTIHHMRNSKVMVSSASTDRYKPLTSAFTQQFGTSMGFLTYDDLKTLFDKADEGLAQKAAEEFARNALRVVEPKPQEIRDGLRFYLAMRNLLKQEKANAVTVDCFPGLLAHKLPAYPCIAWSKLNDSGLYGVCEGDVPSTMTQLLVTSYARVPGFVSDPVFDLSHNEVIHAHCVAATKMGGLDGPSAPYLIRHHLETAEGAVLQVLMPSGRQITVARFADPKKLLVSTAEVTATSAEVSGNPDADFGCRSKIRTRVPDAQKWLENYSAGLHRVIFYGDHVAGIERMGRLMGFEVVKEM